MTRKCAVPMPGVHGAQPLTSERQRRIQSAMYAATVALPMIANFSYVLADEKGARTPMNLDMCRGCHGIAGYRTAYPEVYSVPKLGGQQSAYIVKALQDYRTGSRKNPTMRSVAATLSDQEITAIAAYYSGSGK